MANADFTQNELDHISPIADALSTKPLRENEWIYLSRFLDRVSNKELSIESAYAILEMMPPEDYSRAEVLRALAGGEVA